MKKEKRIYDADPGTNSGCRKGENCPVFLLDEQRGVVSLKDKQGNRAVISVAHFNKFLRAAKSGEIREIAPLRRK